MRNSLLALGLAAVALPALPAIAQPGQDYQRPGDRGGYDQGRGGYGQDRGNDGRNDAGRGDRGFTGAIGVDPTVARPGGSGHDGRDDHGRGDRGGYAGNQRDYRNYDWNRREPGQRGYYAERYYRTGGNYRPYRVTRQTRIYRGGNGNYYCRRNDGTTGLIVGAALGGILGNQVGYGDSRTIATLLGGTGGALLGPLDRSRAAQLPLSVRDGPCRSGPRRPDRATRLPVGRICRRAAGTIR